MSQPTGVAKIQISGPGAEDLLIKVAIKIEQKAAIQPAIQPTANEMVDENNLAFHKEIEKKIQDLVQPSKFHITSRPGEKTFFVSIKTITGKTIVGKVGETLPWDWVKSVIQDNEGIPAPQQRYIYRGRVIGNHNTPKSLSFKTDATKAEAELVHLVLLLGGGPCVDGCQESCSKCGHPMPKISREDMLEFHHRNCNICKGRQQEGALDPAKGKGLHEGGVGKTDGQSERNRAQSDEHAQKRKRRDS